MRRCARSCPIARRPDRRGLQPSFAPIWPGSPPLDLSALTPSTRTSIEVIRSAYNSASQGFAQPYGDVAVGGWRNSPYVVIQNVGAYLDLPRFLDSDHQVETAADAEAYIARLSAAPAQLDGETVAHRRGPREGPPPALLPDRQGAAADAPVAGRRTERRHAGRIDRPPHSRQEHRRRLGRPRPRHHHRPLCRRARAPDRRTRAAARGGQRRPRHGGPPGRCRLLSLGAQGFDHHASFA